MTLSDRTPAPSAHRLAGCRVVTTSLSARLLLRNQLEQLREVDWSVVAGDGWEDPPSHVVFHEVPMRRELVPDDAAALVRLVRFFRSHRFDFVQTHTQKASLLALPAARLAGVPALYTVHGAMYFRDNSRLGNLAGWVFEKWCCTWARRVLLQSEEDAHALAAARISRPRKLTYIGNGVALDRFEAPVKDPVADAKPPIVLMISRLVAEKGCRDFIEVARALRGRARFVHVGPVEHDQRDALTSEEIARAEADVGVEFRGYASDVRPHVAEADIVLQPSYREGIPRAVMESAAGGRPVVGYDVRGVREVVPPELDLLASRGDVAAVTGIVRDLIDDPELRVKKAAACQAWVLERFSEERVVERLRQVYREMADAA